MWKVVNTATGEDLKDFGSHENVAREWEHKHLADEEAYIQTRRTGQFHEARPIEHPPARYDGRRKL
jgi:hypothetical protein